MTEAIHVYGDGGMAALSAVVSSLPLGYNLGDRRVDPATGYEYRLVYNAGTTQISTGFFATPAAGSVGLNSVTVSTASNSNHHLGAVVCHNATATTGTYFWGMKYGKPGGVSGQTQSIVTGSAFFISVNGEVDKATTVATALAGNVTIGVNLGGSATATITTGAQSGDVFVSLP